MKDKKLYILLYAFVFMGSGVLMPLIGPYLDSIGFTGKQIGTVTAAGTCTAIFAVPFWGHQYTRLKGRGQRYLLVAGVLLCAALASLLLSHVTVFTVLLPMFVMLYIFCSPAPSLMDSLTLDDGQKFGHIRTFGALGFAVASFGAAFLADAAGIAWIFPLYAGCFIAAAAIVLIMRRRRANEPGETTRGLEHHEPSAPGRREAVRQLIGNRAYLLLLICAFFINGPDYANNTYFSFLYLEGGGVLAGVGIAFLLMAGSEAPFMAMSDWLSDRFGQGRILLVAMVFSIVRFGLFSLGLPAWALIALFPLQGLVNGITLVEFIKYVARICPKEIRGFAIAVYYSFGFSVSTILCQLIGGFLLDHGLLSLSGPQSVYLFFAVYNIAGVVIFLATGLHKKELTPRSESQF